MYAQVSFREAIVTAIVGWLLSGQFMVFLVSLIMLIAGLVSLRSLKKQSPLAPYALQIVGLLFITPVLLLLAVTIKINTEVVTGLLGTIVGYIFGTARLKDERTISRNSDT